MMPTRFYRRRIKSKLSKSNHFQLEREVETRKKIHSERRLKPTTLLGKRRKATKWWD
jgi:hypothetical protein